MRPGRKWRWMPLLFTVLLLGELPGIPADTARGTSRPTRDGAPGTRAPIRRSAPGPTDYRMTLWPAAVGRQLVRVSLPLPRGMLGEGAAVVVSDGKRDLRAAVRALTWHPSAPGAP